MQQVQQHREIETKDYNLKIRTYSEKVMGYRVIICGEYHYIINELYISEMSEILDFLTTLDSKYDDYGLILLQEGYRPFIERHYVYNRRLGKCMFTHKTDTKIANLEEYKAAKWLYSRYDIIRKEAHYND